MIHFLLGMARSFKTKMEIFYVNRIRNAVVEVSKYDQYVANVSRSGSLITRNRRFLKTFRPEVQLPSIPGHALLKANFSRHLVPSKDLSSGTWFTKGFSFWRSGTTNWGDVLPAIVCSIIILASQCYLCYYVDRIVSITLKACSPQATSILFISSVIFG